MRRRQLITAAAGLLAAPFGKAQSWSAHPIRYIVPFPPGGATDAISRVLCERLGARIGQTLIIDNIPGAGGAIGTARLKQASPDGYTIGLGNSATQTITPQLIKSANYNPLTDFTAISMLTEYANVLVVSPNLTVPEMKEFVTLARTKPGALSYGSAGIGSSNHLASALLASKIDVRMTHVPYRGNSAALTDLISGRIDWMFAGLSEVMPFVKDKRLRVIGVSSTTPDPLLPNVRPIADTISGYEMEGFMGVFGPANLPPAFTARLTSEIHDILREPDVTKKFEVQGLRVKSSSSSELFTRVKRDYALWKTVIAEARITAE